MLSIWQVQLEGRCLRGFVNLAINDEVIFWELKPQWHDRPYVFNRQVSDGEKIKVEISWSEHGYMGAELTEFLSLLNMTK